MIRVAVQLSEAAAFAAPDLNARFSPMSFAAPAALIVRPATPFSAAGGWRRLTSAGLLALSLSGAAAAAENESAAAMGADLRPAANAVLQLPLSETEIDTVYRAVDHRLLWTAAADRDAFRAAIRALETHAVSQAGFAPTLEALERAALAAAPNAADDLAITRGALRYAKAMRGQLIRFAALEEDWALRPAPYDAPTELGRAAASGDIAGFLAAQPPTSPAYGIMKAALARYREIEAQGGWPVVPPKPIAPPPVAQPIEPTMAAAMPDASTASDLTIANPSALPANAVLPDGTLAPAEPPKFPVLEPGARDSRVPALRARLAAEDAAEGEVVTVAADDDLYDSALVDAMKRFQERHGLMVDGRVGERSFAALNVSAGARARQIALNLERLRWEPRTEPARHVLVNVPDAHMDLIENGVSVLRMRVVVGARKTSTPTLASAIDRITVWPRWTLPYSIATKEQLPKLQQNPSHLAEQNIVLLGRDGDPHGRDIDWSAYSTANFPFRLQQRAGPDNALGTFRFNFNNRFAVYLHDTPKKKGFARAVRAASHGCVRLEDARALALALLGRDKGMSETEIDALLAAGRTRDLTLATPVPVRLIYLTAFAGANGVIQFRNDIYGRDATLARVLERTRS